MTTPANFLPAHNGELHEFEVRYYDDGSQINLPRIARHTLTSKSVANALKSFARAVPRHGRILGIRKVVPQ